MQKKLLNKPVNEEPFFYRGKMNDNYRKELWLENSTSWSLVPVLQA